MGAILVLGNGLIHSETEKPMEPKRSQSMPFFYYPKLLYKKPVYQQKQPFGMDYRYAYGQRTLVLKTEFFFGCTKDDDTIPVIVIPGSRLEHEIMKQQAKTIHITSQNAKDTTHYSHYESLIGSILAVEKYQSHKVLDVQGNIGWTELILMTGFEDMEGDGTNE